MTIIQIKSIYLRYSNLAGAYNISPDTIHFTRFIWTKSLCITQIYTDVYILQTEYTRLRACTWSGYHTVSVLQCCKCMYAKFMCFRIL